MTGFAGADVWADWIANDLDQASGVAHREALTLGSSYVIVWARPDGTPRGTVESARQVAMLTDPGSRRVVAACKRWETATSTEAVIYEPDEITRLRRARARAPPPPASAWSRPSPTRSAWCRWSRFAQRRPAPRRRRCARWPTSGRWSTR